jgi:hypothetical protein
MPSVRHNNGVGKCPEQEKAVNAGENIRLKRVEGLRRLEWKT